MSALMRGLAVVSSSYPCSAATRVDTTRESMDRVNRIGRGRNGARAYNFQKDKNRLVEIAEIATRFAGSKHNLAIRRNTSPKSAEDSKSGSLCRTLAFSAWRYESYPQCNDLHIWLQPKSSVIIITLYCVVMRFPVWQESAIVLVCSWSTTSLQSLILILITMLPESKVVSLDCRGM